MTLTELRALVDSKMDDEMQRFTDRELVRALLAVASAAHGAVSGPDLWEATDLHLINVAKDLREALAKLKEAGVTI